MCIHFIDGSSELVMHHPVQRVAVCCSVLQCTAVCCSVLHSQWTTTHTAACSTTHTAGCFVGSNVAVSQVLFISRVKLENAQKNTFFPKNRVESEGKRESLNSPGGGNSWIFRGFPLVGVIPSPPENLLQDGTRRFELADLVLNFHRAKSILPPA